MTASIRTEPAGRATPQHHADGDRASLSSELACSPRPSGAAGSSLAHDLVMLLPRLRAYARSLTHNAEAANDLVQDTLLRAWGARGRFAEGSNLKAWTFKILRNVFLTERRRARFSASYDEATAERRSAVAEAQSMTVELKDVEEAIRRLPWAHQHALRLVAIDGLSYEDAALRSGIPIGTLKSRVWRARQELRTVLSDQAPAT